MRRRTVASSLRFRRGELAADVHRLHVDRSGNLLRRVECGVGDSERGLIRIFCKLALAENQPLTRMGDRPMSSMEDTRPFGSANTR
jgi:hypothetical protein